MSDRCSVWIEGSWVVIRSPYRPGFVEALKGVVPWGMRRWESGLKLWFVDQSYMQEVVDLCEQYFDEVHVAELEPEVVEVPVAHASEEARMIELCPNSVLPKVARTIMAALHPDTGGSTERFQEFSAVWEEVRRRRGI